MSKPSPEIKVKITHRLRIRFGRNDMSMKVILMWGVASFLGFGPFYHLLFNYSWAYSLSQGTFIAVFEVAVLSLIYAIRKRADKKELHSRSS